MSVTKSPPRVIFQKSDNLNDTVSEDLEVANVVLNSKGSWVQPSIDLQTTDDKAGFFF